MTDRERDPKEPEIVVERSAPDPDRFKVFEFILTREIPDGELDWLWPAIAAEEARLARLAEEARRTREAWCVACGGVVTCDELGCLACRCGTPSGAFSIGYVVSEPQLREELGIPGGEDA